MSKKVSMVISPNDIPLNEHNIKRTIKSITHVPHHRGRTNV